MSGCDWTTQPVVRPIARDACAKTTTQKELSAPRMTSFNRVIQLTMPSFGEPLFMLSRPQLMPSTVWLF
jgi:hypothetical protein